MTAGPRGFAARPHRARGAPPGAEVGLYVDLVATVNVGDVIETRSGRRYGVVSVRRQDRGKHAGRQHLRAIVLDDTTSVMIGDLVVGMDNGEIFRHGQPTTPSGRVHRIRWYNRARSSGGVAPRGADGAS